MVTNYILFYENNFEKILREFWGIHSDAEQSLKAWHAKAKLAEWNTSSDIKSDYRNASFVANNRVIFNIKGNTYRFVGSHKEYDKIDATTI